MADFVEQALNVLERQYGYTNIAALMQKKGEVYNKYVGELEATFRDEIMNIDTCIPDALDYYWGKRFKITRNFYDNDGNLLTLTDELFREIIKIRAFAARWDGAVTTVNEFLVNIFGDRGITSVFDPQNMFIWYLFAFPLTPEELFLFRYRDILPRPAGVGIDVIDNADIFYFAMPTYDTWIDYPIASGFGTYSDTPDDKGRFSTYGDLNG